MTGINVAPSRLVLDPQYAEQLGRALYAFAYLEYALVWLAESVHDGFVRKSADWTSRRIANEFSASTKGNDELMGIAFRFGVLVTERDALMHGVPYSAHGEAQRLWHRGRQGNRHWHPDRVDAVRLAFEALAADIDDVVSDGRLMALEQYRLSDAESSQWSVAAMKTTPS